MSRGPVVDNAKNLAARGATALLLLLTACPVCAGPMGPFPGTNGDDIAATALLATGVILLLLEVKIVSFGILGVLGTACLALGTGVIWENGGALWGISMYYIVPLILLIFILTVAMSVLAAQAYKERVTSGREGFVGEVAEASEALAPEGRVFFQGTYWQAESTAPIAAGQKVRIIGVDRLKLYVEPMGG